MDFERKLKCFLVKHGVNYTSSKQSFVSKCINPACGKEEHLYIRKRDGKTKCFRCGMGWSWKTLVSIIAGVPLEYAYGAFHGEGAGELIDKPLKLDMYLYEHHEEEEGPAAKPLTAIMMGEDFIPFHKSPEALRYLEGRGVTPAMAGCYDVRFHAAMQAVVFPVRKSWSTYGWQARRVVNNVRPRLLTMPNFDKSRFLLNQDSLCACPENVILVEGPFDCIKADIPGFPAVASLGKSVSYDQIKILLDSRVKNIYVGLDADAASEVYEVIDKIGFNKKVFRIRPPLGFEDFGECPPDEVRRAIDGAMNTTALFLEAYFKETL